MPRQTLAHLFQVVLNGLRQERTRSYLFLTENADNDSYPAEDLHLAANFFRLWNLVTAFVNRRDTFLSISVPEDFDFSSRLTILDTLRGIGFQITEERGELSINHGGENAELLRQRLRNWIRPAAPRAIAVADEGAAAAADTLPAPAEIQTDPLEYFTCPISFTSFAAGQVINVLPNGSLVAQDIILRWMNINRTNPITRAPLAQGIRFYTPRESFCGFFIVA